MAVFIRFNLFWNVALCIMVHFEVSETSVTYKMTLHKIRDFLDLYGC